MSDKGTASTMIIKYANLHPAMLIFSLWLAPIQFAAMLNPLDLVHRIGSFLGWQTDAAVEQKGKHYASNKKKKLRKDEKRLQKRLDARAAEIANRSNEGKGQYDNAVSTPYGSAMYSTASAYMSSIITWVSKSETEETAAGPVAPSQVSQQQTRKGLLTGDSGLQMEPMSQLPASLEEDTASYQKVVSRMTGLPDNVVWSTYVAVGSGHSHHVGSGAPPVALGATNDAVVVPPAPPPSLSPASLAAQALAPVSGWPTPSHHHSYTVALGTDDFWSTRLALLKESEETIQRELQWRGAEPDYLLPGIRSKLELFTHNLKRMESQLRFDDDMRAIIWRAVIRANYFWPKTKRSPFRMRLVLGSTTLGEAAQHDGVAWRASTSMQTGDDREFPTRAHVEDAERELNELLDAAIENCHTAELAALAFLLYSNEAIHKVLTVQEMRERFNLAFKESVRLERRGEDLIVTSNREGMDFNDRKWMWPEASGGERETRVRDAWEMWTSI